MAYYVWIGNGDHRSWGLASNWEVQVGAYYQAATHAPGLSDMAAFTSGDDALFGNGEVGGIGVAYSGTTLSIEQGYVTANSFEGTLNGALKLINAGQLSITGTNSSDAFYTSQGGSVLVSGSGSSLAVQGTAYFGTTGSGNTLQVIGGGVVTVNNNTGDPDETTLAVGQGSGANASAAVSGANSQINETGGAAVIGFDSTAFFTISDDASASFEQADDESVALAIGLSQSNFSSFANLTVTGAGSSLTTTLGYVQVGDGHEDQATLDILAGASATFTQTAQYSPVLAVGDDDSTGTVLVSGAGSKLTTVSGGVQISNHDGNGTLDVYDGGVVSINNAADASPPPFEIGFGDGTGHVNVDDLSTLTVDAAVSIGAVGGTGSLTVDDGAFSNDGFAFIVGDDDAGGIQPSTFALNNYAQAATGDTYFGLDDGATGSGVVNGNSESSSTGWTITGYLRVGDQGGGFLTVEDDASLVINNSDVDDVSLVLGLDATGAGSLHLISDALDLGDGGLAVGVAGQGTLDLRGATLDVASPQADDEFAVYIGGSAGGVGLISLDDESSLSVGDGGLVVGDDGVGHLSVDDGSLLSVTSSTYGFDVGADPGSNGTVKVGGDDSAIGVDDTAVIGDGGVGKLIIDDDGGFGVLGDGSLLEVGLDSGSSGSILLAGDDAQLVYDDILTIGDAGKGFFELDDDASFALGDDIVLASQAGSSGEVELYYHTNLEANNLIVGDDGLGTMNVTDDSSVSISDTLYIGADDDLAVSTLDVDGAGSTLDADEIVVGVNGYGAMNIDDGSVTADDALIIADDEYSNGAVNIYGAGSLEVDDLVVGGDGTGELDMFGGDLTVHGAMGVGNGENSEGVVTLSDDATLTLDDYLIISEFGPATFSVTNGSFLDADNQSVTIGDGDDAGTLTVEDDDSGARMDVLVIGDDGQGALNVLDHGVVLTTGSAILGQSATSLDDVAKVDGKSLWTVDEDLTIAAGGEATVSVTDDGDLTVKGDLLVGDGVASSGKLEVDGDDGTTENVSSVGYGGSLVIGDDGVGSLDISDDGLVTFEQGGTGVIDIGAAPDGQGTVAVDGKGSLLEGDDLTIGGADGMEGGGGILNISDQAKVSVKAVTVTGSGSVVLGGGVLDTDPITIDADGEISGFGGVYGDIVNNGDIIASGGLLDIDDDVSGGEFEIDPDASLALEMVVADDPTVRFNAGGDETLDLGAPLSFSAQEIDGFVAGDTIDLGGFSYDGPATVTLGSDDTLTLENSVDETVALKFDAADIGSTFAMSSDGDDGIFVEINPPCYVRGTRILTDRGEVAVERLSVGDFTITASGAPRPIVWLGRRRIDFAGHRDPAAVRPVRVSAGAFGQGAPRRDLWLSPGHNIVSDGVLMPISSLINGVSVAQVEAPSVEYWHVELDAHDILLAEGLPAESYLDCGNRTAFTNGGAFVEAHPDFAPKHWAETCLPLVKQGPPVTRTRARLLARLAEQGHRVTQEADAHVLVDGARVEPIVLSPTRLAFLLPAGGREIALRSNVFVPAHTASESEDTRELGLCVGRLQIDGVAVALDRDGAGASGWREGEFAGERFARRWTTGATPLPPDSRIIVVDLVSAGHYLRRPELRPAAAPSLGAFDLAEMASLRSL